MTVKGLPGGDFSHCVQVMAGKVDDPPAFCAWKTYELTGKWPAEEGAPPPPDGVRNTEVFQCRFVEREEKTGREWDVTVIGPATPDDLIEIHGRRYIRSANHRLYSLEGISASTEQWEGVKVYDNHLTDSEFEEKAGMRAFLAEGVGILTDPYFDALAGELKARLIVVDDAAAQKLKNAFDAGVLSYIGLSVDTQVKNGKPVQYNGQTYPVVDAFEHIWSADIVSEPAAGGKFNRILAAQQYKEEVGMEVTKEMVMEWIAEALSQLGLTAQDAVKAVGEEIQAAAEEVPEDAQPEDAAQVIADAVQDVAVAESERLEALEQRLRIIESDKFLTEQLDAAKLGKLRPVVEAAFKGKLFNKDVLAETIKRAKETQAQEDKTGNVKGVGGARVQAVFSERDKYEIGVLLMLSGFSPFWNLRAIEQSKDEEVRARMTPAVRAWQNAGRPVIERPGKRSLGNWLYSLAGGDPYKMRAREANDVSSITSNVVNLFLAAHYAVKEEWWKDIVTELEVDSIDDVTLVRMYGLGNLSVVTAGAPYTDLELSDDEETGSYVKYGNTVSVKMETLLKDKLDVLARIPMMLADSWYNTQSSLVANVFTVNSGAGPVLSDGGALFNATAVTTAGGHANLLTAALDIDAYGAARTAMMKQTSMKLGEGRRLTTNIPRYMLVSVDGESDGLVVRNSEYRPGGNNNDKNPYYQQFDVIPVPDWTDANDWALVSNPAEFPAIYMIYVRGYRVPLIYSADDEGGGAVFTNDTWRWKVRLMTFRFSDTYNCAPVADFRPLHKNNVA